MGKFIDLTGQKFERLTACYPTKKRASSGSIIWRCICDCGNECEIRSDHWGRSKTKSCGCLKNELTSKRSTVHGYSKHPLYRIWQSMIQRCENPKNKSYYTYGQRGISVCREWHNPAIFIKWALTNGWEKGLTIDRCDNDGSYSSTNCMFVSRLIQNGNTRKNKLFIAYGPHGQIEAGKNQSAFARKWGFLPSISSISACLHNKRKTHKGWIFEYLEKLLPGENNV